MNRVLCALAIAIVVHAMLAYGEIVLYRDRVFSGTAVHVSTNGSDITIRNCTFTAGASLQLTYSHSDTLVRVVDCRFISPGPIAVNISVGAGYTAPSGYTVHVSGSVFTDTTLAVYSGGVAAVKVSSCALNNASVIVFGMYSAVQSCSNPYGLYVAGIDALITDVTGAYTVVLGAGGELTRSADIVRLSLRTGGRLYFSPATHGCGIYDCPTLTGSQVDTGRGPTCAVYTEKRLAVDGFDWPDFMNLYPICSSGQYLTDDCECVQCPPDSLSTGRACASTVGALLSPDFQYNATRLAEDALVVVTFDSDLTMRVDALVSQIGSLSPADVAVLTDHVLALDAADDAMSVRVDGILAQIGAENVTLLTAALTNIRSNVSTLTTTLTGIQSDVLTLTTTLTGIQSDVSTLTDRVFALDPAAVSEQLLSISDRIGVAESLVSELDSIAEQVNTTAALVDDVELLSSRLGTTDVALQSMQADIESVDLRVTALNTTGGQLVTQVDGSGGASLITVMVSSGIAALSILGSMLVIALRALS